MRPIARVLASAVVCTFALTGLVAAQDTAVQGVFVSANSSKEVISKAIDTAIAKMNFLARAVGKSRLLATNPLYERIEITNDGSQISVRFDKRKPIVMPADGTPVKWKRDDGEEFDVTAQAQGSQLQQTFRAEDGQRVNDFSLGPDGTLVLSVTVTSPQLPEPVRYTLNYRRS